MVGGRPRPRPRPKPPGRASLKVDRPRVFVSSANRTTWSASSRWRTCCLNASDMESFGLGGARGHGVRRGAGRHPRGRRSRALSPTRRTVYLEAPGDIVAQATRVTALLTGRRAAFAHGRSRPLERLRALLFGEDSFPNTSSITRMCVKPAKWGEFAPRTAQPAVLFLRVNEETGHQIANA